MRGRVKKWFESRGFGFVTNADGRDFFVHCSAISSTEMFKTLREGDSVEFDIGPARDPTKPPAAINVVRVQEPAR